MSNTGLNNLLKFYKEAFASHHTIRQRVARHYVELAKSEIHEISEPAFNQLKADLLGDTRNLQNRTILESFIDTELEEAFRDSSKVTSWAT
jgi:la-related protein 1